LAGAAAVATAAGDVRLATLLAAAGSRREGAAKLGAQLGVWAGARMTPAIAPSRLLVYKLLSGQVRGCM
jgi:hypothetical protein